MDPYLSHIHYIYLGMHAFIGTKRHNSNGYMESEFPMTLYLKSPQIKTVNG